MRPGKQNLHYRLELQAKSLEDWWELWLQGRLRYERESLPRERLPAPAEVLEFSSEMPQFEEIRPFFEAIFEPLATDEEETWQ